MACERSASPAPLVVKVTFDSELFPGVPGQEEIHRVSLEAIPTIEQLHILVTGMLPPDKKQPFTMEYLDDESVRCSFFICLCLSDVSGLDNFVYTDRARRCSVCCTRETAHIRKTKT